MLTVTICPTNNLGFQQLMWELDVLEHILYPYHDISEMDHDCKVAIENPEPCVGGRVRCGYFHER